MQKSSLFIDGENFKFRIKKVLEDRGIDKTGLAFLDFDIDSLFNQILKDTHLLERNYYCAKLHYYKETAKVSEELIQEQRKLKRNLTSKGFNFVISGNVRMQTKVNKLLGSKYVFHEKGVDVKMAVDLVSYSYDKKVDRIFLCSSDSDLQPAITKARSKGMKITYIGFESNQNKGLASNTDKTVLIKESQIIECFAGLNPWGKS